MTPGRELDALVAEKVMGWTRMSYEQAYHYAGRKELTGYWHSTTERDRYGRSKEMARAEDDLDYYQPEDAWSPSTDMAAAWEVVERLSANVEFDIGTALLPGTTATRGWMASFQFRTFVAFAPTAPYAICLAALKAVGVER